MKLFNIYLYKLNSLSYWKKLLKHDKLNICILIGLLLFIYYIILTLWKTIYHLIRKKNPNTTWLLESRKYYNIVDHPPPIQTDIIPSGFIGNGKGYGSEFGSEEYKSIPLLGNHDRDKERTRMLRGWWPEFKWCEYPNSSYDRKLYMRAEQDITRLLYNNHIFTAISFLMYFI